MFGLALDLSSGTVAFTNTSRLEGDLGVSGADLRFGMISDKIELKYLYSICKKGGCALPRALAVGGGIRYEYASTSIETSGVPAIDRSVHRLIFFAELARF
jgi:hypothetical protein